MGFVGCSSGAGRLPGNLARTWLDRRRLGRGRFRVSPPRLGRDRWRAIRLPLGRARFRVTSPGLGRKAASGNLSQPWAGALPGNPARRPGDISRTAGATGTAAVPPGPPCAREANGVRCEPAGRLLGEGLRAAWKAVPGSLARPRFRVTPPAGRPITREPLGLRGRQWCWQGLRARARRAVCASGPGPRPGRAGGTASWFFRPAIQTLFFGNPKRTPERARPGAAPKQGPRVCKKGASRGAAAGSRVTWPKKGETARWRPPFRAGAVSEGAVAGGAVAAGVDGVRALRRLGAFGQRGLGRLPGNLSRLSGTVARDPTSPGRPAHGPA